MTRAERLTGGGWRSSPARRGAWLLAVVLLASGGWVFGPWAAEDGASRAQDSPDRRARTVIVVRHGEKDPAGDARDPSLSPAGSLRAKALAHLLGPARVTHLFASEFRRTQETLAPLAEQSGRKVSIVPARETDRLLAEIAALPGGSVCVIAGHSNTVPKIVSALGTEIGNLVESSSGKAIPEDEFGRLFVITLPQSGARAVCDTSTLELRY